MRRARSVAALGLLACLVCAAPGAAQEKKLTLRWFGQSFFQLTTGSGLKIVFDPHAIEAYGRPTAAADLVLISHPHTDHAQLGSVENVAKAKVIHGVKGTGRKAEWVKVDEAFHDVRVRSVGVYHDDEMGFRRGKNSVFVVEADGLRIVHLGDLGHELTEAQAKAIGPVDVLLVPVGGIYTINGGQAKQVMGQLKPRLFVLPMHYGTKVYDDLLAPDEFLDGQANVKKYLDSNTLEIPAGLKVEAPSVVLLGWKK